MIYKLILLVILSSPLYAEENFEPFPDWFPLIAIALMILAKIIVGKRIKDRVDKEEEENKITESKNEDESTENKVEDKSTENKNEKLKDEKDKIKDKITENKNEKLKNETNKLKDGE